MTFYDWLIQQKHRHDAAGALATAVGAVEAPKSSGRQQDEHKRWAEFLSRHGNRQHILAFNEAWDEFLKARDIAQDLA